MRLAELTLGRNQPKATNNRDVMTSVTRRDIGGRVGEPSTANPMSTLTPRSIPITHNGDHGREAQRCRTCERTSATPASQTRTAPSFSTFQLRQPLTRGASAQLTTRTLAQTDAT
jgi:hypothetical protein